MEKIYLSPDEYTIVTESYGTNTAMMRCLTMKKQSLMSAYQKLWSKKKMMLNQQMSPISRRESLKGQDKMDRRNINAELFERIVYIQSRQTPNRLGR